LKYQDECKDKVYYDKNNKFPNYVLQKKEFLRLNDRSNSLCKVYFTSSRNISNQKIDVSTRSLSRVYNPVYHKSLDSSSDVRNLKDVVIKPQVSVSNNNLSQIK